VDKAEVGQARVGFFRVGVMVCDWDNKILPALKKKKGSDIWKEMLKKFKLR